MSDHSFWESLNVQCRVVHALFMREIITRYGRHNIGFLWLFIEPMMFTSTIVALWVVTKNTHGSNLPIAAFAITGYSSLLLWRNTGNRCAKAIEPNLSLMYHRNVRVQDILMARVLVELMGATVSFGLLTIVCALMGWVEWPQNILLVILGWALLAVFATGLGFIVGALSELSETFERVWHIFTYIMFPAGGAMYLVEWLPPAAREVVLWMPMVHATEMIRHGFFGSLIKTHENIWYLFFVDMVFVFIGLLLVRDVSSKVQPE